MSDTDILAEIRERYLYAKNAWKDIRDEGAKDMRFVAGDPWDANDKDARKDRPTVAPEEMGQYFNQVINQLRANPRGMHFAPTGNGASPQGARFYQNKARETEYRSHAKIAYIAAAENAIQRSYGFLRVNTRFANPRSANQDVWIEDIPDPDMVLPDPDAKRPDSSDMKYCFVLQWDDQEEFKRTPQGKSAKVHNFGDFSASQPDWVQGKKILQAEYWTLTTRPRTLLLVQPPAPPMPPQMRAIAPHAVPPPKPLQMFADELAQLPPGATVLRELRTVDYPAVKMYRTNGLEILHEQDWAGKYIPIVSCYGKILYVPDGGSTKRVILSMTRFGRDPWKSYCYACSQELEILGQVPKASVIAGAGQLAGFEKDWEESYHVPKAFMLFHMKTAATGDTVLPPPSRLAYTQGENLQALEVVKEGFRRAIQSAMGSNFLPTEAQQRNQKSGIALDKIDQAATSGTFHFVDHYDDLIRQTAVILEDLCDKIYDYQGETGVVEADGTAKSVAINDPTNKDAVSTAGDYQVTVSSGPSSDSEQEAAAEFVDTLIQNIEVIAQLAGPKAAAAIFAQGIRMRNLGPQGDFLADILDPPPPDGQEPPSPQLMAAQNQIQTLTQKLQQAMQAIQTKQIENQGKLEIAQLKDHGDLVRAAMDREVRLAVAEIAAQSKQALQDMALFYEERARVGAQIHEHAMGGQEIAKNVALAHHAAVAGAIEGAKDRTHDLVMAQTAHAHALELGDQGVAGQMAVQDNAPQPDAGAGA